MSAYARCRNLWNSRKSFPMNLRQDNVYFCCFPLSRLAAAITFFHSNNNEWRSSNFPSHHDCSLPPVTALLRCLTPWVFRRHFARKKLQTCGGAHLQFAHSGWSTSQTHAIVPAAADGVYFLGYLSSLSFKRRVRQASARLVREVNRPFVFRGASRADVVTRRWEGDLRPTSPPHQVQTPGRV